MKVKDRNAATSVTNSDRLYPAGSAGRREFALWYFGALICFWNILGHTVIGFEQSWAAPFVAVGSACLFQYLLELADAWGRQRPLRPIGTTKQFITFMIPAVISGLAISMLIYPANKLWPFIFGTALAIGSKVLFRAPFGRGTQHFFNPSNFALTVLLFLLPWVGAAPPYHFTENIFGIWNWALPALIMATGIFVHGYATGRLPIVLAWLGGFVAQGLVRAALAGAPLAVPLMPMTSTAFIIFTLYMIPDPATTPIKAWRQVFFSLSVAAVYGLLQTMHVVYGLFLALTIVSAFRGIGLYVISMLNDKGKTPTEAMPVQPAKEEQAVSREPVGSSR